MKLVQKALCLVLSALTLTCTNSCSVIGYAIGSSIQNKKNAPHVLQGWQWVTIKPGNLVAIQCKDGTEVKGDYLGARPLNIDEYSARLRAVPPHLQTISQHMLPGQSVTVEMNSGEKVEGAFVGFDRLLGDGLPNWRLDLVKTGDTATTHIYMLPINSVIAPNGERVLAADLTKGLENGSLPTLTAISVNCGVVATIEKTTGQFLGDENSVKKAVIKSVILKSGKCVEFDWQGGRYSVGDKRVFGRTIYGLGYHCFIADVDTVSILERIAPFQEALVPLSEVAAITRIGSQSHAATIGFLVGFTIDLAMFAAAIAFSSTNMGPSGMSMESSGGIGSCPFIYSQCNGEWVIDAELFGGALFKAAQRTDVVALRFLQTEDDFAQLRLTNELPETEYVDALKLLAVDHTPGLRIIPDFAGKLHTVALDTQPVEAVDFAGRDVLPLIERTDSRLWISDPFASRASGPQCFRDGVIVKFLKPKNAKSAKLVLNAQNTPWASKLQEAMISLRGTDLPSWYQQMNSSPSDRYKLVTASIREGMLQVKTLDENDWIDQGFIWEVGPRVPRDVVTEIDLAANPGDTVTVKLESNVGLWMLNSVSIDYSIDQAVMVSECAMKDAIDQGGDDLREVLSITDSAYYEMPTTDYFATIGYEVPSVRTGMSRTYLLESSGYYNIHTDTTRPSQAQLAEKIIREPGAFGQFAQSLLESYVRQAMITQNSNVDGEMSYEK